MTSAGRPRVREWLIRLTWGGLAVAWLLAPAVHADRSSQNMDPAYMFEKAGQFDKAAMYYQRVLRGLRETYISSTGTATRRPTPPASTPPSTSICPRRSRSGWRTAWAGRSRPRSRSGAWSFSTICG